MVLSNIFPYLDGDDVVELSNDANEIFHDQDNVLDYFHWEMDSPTIKRSTDLTTAFFGRPTHEFYDKSSLAFQVGVFVNIHRRYVTCSFISSRFCL